MSKTGMRTGIPVDLVLRLSTREAQVAALRWGERMRVAEVAARLGISENQVRQHLCRVRKKAKSLASGLTDPAGLSKRQVQVMELKDSGKTVAEICYILGIKQATARRHIAEARRKRMAGKCITRIACQSEIPPPPAQEPPDQVSFDFAVSTSYPRKEEALAAASTGLGTREEREVLFRERRKLRKKLEVSARSQLLRAEGFWSRLLRDVLEDCFFKVDGSWAPRDEDSWRVLAEERDLRLQELSSSPDGLLVLRRPAPNRLAVASAARRVKKPESSGVGVVTGLGPGCAVRVDKVEREVSEVVFCLKRKQYLSCDSAVLVPGDMVCDAGEGRLLVVAWADESKPWTVQADKGWVFKAGAA